MFQKTYTLSLLILICSVLSAQQPVSVVFYNGPGNGVDQAVDLAANDSNNVFVTGVSYGGTSSKDDIYTAKYYLDYTGARRVIWSTRYNAPANSGNNVDVPSKMVIDAQSNVYVCGTTYKYGDVNTADYITLKYNSAGALQWAVRFNGESNSFDYASDIAVDNSGNVYVTGTSNDCSTDEDYATVKYNPSGVQQWVKRYDGPIHKGDFAKSIAVDNSGNVYVTGLSYASGQGQNIVTIKYLSNGTQSWLVSYNGPGNGNDFGTEIATDRSGNIIVGGTSKGSNTGYDYLVLKYNSSGAQQWLARYNGLANQDDSLKGMGLDIFNNIFVTGGSNKVSGNSDYATIKYSSSGVMVWNRTYNGTGNGTDIGTAISVSNRAYEPESYRKVYAGVTGLSLGSGSGNDYYTIFYDEKGNEVWNNRFNRLGSSTDVPTACATTNLIKMIYVTGGSNSDFCTIAYNKDVNSNPFASPVNHKSEERIYNYPNPFNPKTVISFQLTVSSLVSLKVFDMLGREVSVLVKGELKEGTYEVDFPAPSENGTNFPSGVYYYILKTDNFTETKRMILVK